MDSVSLYQVMTPGLLANVNWLPYLIFGAMGVAGWSIFAKERIRKAFIGNQGMGFFMAVVLLTVVGMAVSLPAVFAKFLHILYMITVFPIAVMAALSNIITFVYGLVKEQ